MDPCLEYRSRLAAYAFGDQTHAAVLEAHLTLCHVCEHAYREHRELANALQLAVPTYRGPGELQSRLGQRITALTRWLAGTPIAPVGVDQIVHL